MVWVRARPGLNRREIGSRDHTDGVGASPAGFEQKRDRIQGVHDRPDSLAGAHQPLQPKFLISQPNGLKIDPKLPGKRADRGQAFAWF